MKNEHDYISDRVSLEWLVIWSLSQEDPIISIGRGKELLGFTDMQQMRDFMNKHRNSFIQGPRFSCKYYFPVECKYNMDEKLCYSCRSLKIHSE